MKIVPFIIINTMLFLTLIFYFVLSLVTFYSTPLPGFVGDVVLMFFNIIGFFIFTVPIFLLFLIALNFLEKFSLVSFLNRLIPMLAILGFSLQYIIEPLFQIFPLLICITSGSLSVVLLYTVRKTLNIC